MMTGTEIEELYHSYFDEGPFPYEDCFALAKRKDIPSSDFIPELDWYIFNIAGYSSWASKLVNRPIEERQKAKKLLEKNFYEYFPDLARLESMITQDQTPTLFELMKQTEIARLALLELLGSVDCE
jgi:hypothetical protein